MLSVFKFILTAIYLLRLQRQKETITPGTTQPEVFNVLGQLEALEKGLRENTLSLDAKKTKKIGCINSNAYLQKSS